MESDLISRSEAIEALNQHSYETISDYDKTVELLNEIPAVDAVPVVHARWLYTTHHEHCFRVSFDGWLHCPNCYGAFRRIVGTKLFAHCPNCGARMDGKEDTNGHQTD